MTNEELNNIIKINTFYTITNNSGDKFTGLIDGPYNGLDKPILEGYDLDYIYITLVTVQQQILKVFSHNIVQIEELEL